MVENSQTAMGGYEDVNREIHNFLSQRRSVVEEPQQREQKVPHILPLLESLNRTYSDINACLRSGNADALKDTILKSDIKMSLVCETLLETLKLTTEEKNKLTDENAKLCAMRRELEEKRTQQRLHIEQLERDLECRKSEVRELERIIQDQKDRMHEYREEAQRAKSDSVINLTKVKELENLRAKAMERLRVYEREMDAIRSLIKERDERIATLMREKRTEEDKNSSIKIRIVECEKMVEVMNKKMESKDLNLSLCNEELSKVLAENKMMKGDFDKYREKAAYYEGLYSNLNKQNAYLNAQLNKLLKDKEYSKDGAAFVRKYRKKNNKRKRLIKKLKEENNKLKVDARVNADATCTATIVTDSSETIVRRVDELTEANKALRRQIHEIESAKKDVESKMRRLELASKRDHEELQIQRRVMGDGFKASKETMVKPSSFGWRDERLTNPLIGREYRTDYAANSGFSGDRLPKDPPFRELFSSPNGMTAVMPELRGDKEKETYPKPNLYNNYDESGTKEIPGGFVDDTIMKLQVEDDKPASDNFLKNSVFPGPLSTLFEKPKPIPLYQPSVKKTPSLPLNSSKVPAQTIDRPAEPRVVAEGHSNDSIKSYHTTSTLKDMIARTDRLQQRFESLEGQLACIKEGNTEERLVNKMRAYSTHCSELNADSNDSDFI